MVRDLGIDMASCENFDIGIDIETQTLISNNFAAKLFSKGQILYSKYVIHKLFMDCLQ